MAAPIEGGGSADA
uniref:Uncharacterized protein n=1 Tax=Arundo donax TaxID=35708 RepID=A0A0A9BR66_ARUDO